MALNNDIESVGLKLYKRHDSAYISKSRYVYNKNLRETYLSNESINLELIENSRFENYDAKSYNSVTDFALKELKKDEYKQDSYYLIYDNSQIIWSDENINNKQQKGTIMVFYKGYEPDRDEPLIECSKLGNKKIHPTAYQWDYNNNGYDLALMLPAKKKADNNVLYLGFCNDVLQYKCIAPNGEYQENTITWKELQENGADHKLKPKNEQLLEEFEKIKTAILMVTSKRSHTHNNDKKNLSGYLKDNGYDLALMLPAKKKADNNVLYLGFCNDVLQYKCIAPDGECQESTITWKELQENGADHKLKPENGQLLKEFEKIKTAILMVTSKRGHTQDNQLRIKKALEKDIFFGYNTGSASYNPYKRRYNGCQRRPVTHVGTQLDADDMAILNFSGFLASKNKKNIEMEAEDFAPIYLALPPNIYHKKELTNPKKLNQLIQDHYSENEQYVSSEKEQLQTLINTVDFIDDKQEREDALQKMRETLPIRRTKHFYNILLDAKQKKFSRPLLMTRKNSQHLCSATEGHYGALLFEEESNKYVIEDPIFIDTTLKKKHNEIGTNCHFSADETVVFQKIIDSTLQSRRKKNEENVTLPSFSYKQIPSSQAQGDGANCGLLSIIRVACSNIKLTYNITTAQEDEVCERGRHALERAFKIKKSQPVDKTLEDSQAFYKPLIAYWEYVFKLVHSNADLKSRSWVVSFLDYLCEKENKKKYKKFKQLKKSLLNNKPLKLLEKIKIINTMIENDFPGFIRNNKIKVSNLEGDFSFLRITNNNKKLNSIKIEIAKNILHDARQLDKNVNAASKDNKEISERKKNLKTNINKLINIEDFFYGKKLSISLSNLTTYLDSIEGSAWKPYHTIVVDHFLDLTNDLLNRQNLITKEEIGKSQETLEKKLGAACPMSKTLKAIICAVFAGIFGFIVGGVVVGICAGGIGAIPGAITGAVTGFSASVSATGGGALVIGGAVGFFSAKKNNQLYKSTLNEIKEYTDNVFTQLQPSS